MRLPSGGKHGAERRPGGGWKGDGQVETLLQRIKKKFRDWERERWRNNSLGPSGSSLFQSHKTLWFPLVWNHCPQCWKQWVLTFSFEKTNNHDNNFRVVLGQRIDIFLCTKLIRVLGKWTSARGKGTSADRERRRSWPPGRKLSSSVGAEENTFAFESTQSGRSALNIYDILPTDPESHVASADFLRQRAHFDLPGV